jgi:DNA-binding LytR/AlgR family response regulator
MNYIIIENEPIALQNIIEICNTLRPNWCLVGTFEGISDTVSFLKDDHPKIDLALFDIELVDGNCFDIFKQIDIYFPIIFTTAYEEYLLKAFRVNSLDYILKPISLNALKAAFDKYDKLYNKQDAAVDPTIYHKLLETLQLSGTKNYCSRILTSTGDHYGYVDINDVAYFISEDKYTFVVTFSGKRLFTTYISLNEIENDLDEKRFFRLSRSIIANIEVISSVSKYFGGRLLVTIKTSSDSLHIMVSSARRKLFLQWLGSGTVQNS